MVDVDDALGRQPDVPDSMRPLQGPQAVPRVDVRRRAHVLHHLRRLAHAVYLDLRHVVQHARELRHLAFVVQEEPDEVALRVQRDNHRSQARHRVPRPRGRLLRARAVRSQAHDQVGLGALARHSKARRVPPPVGHGVKHPHQIPPDRRGPPRRGLLVEYPANAAHISPRPIVSHPRRSTSRIEYYPNRRSREEPCPVLNTGDPSKTRRSREGRNPSPAKLHSHSPGHSPHSSSTRA